MEPASAGVRPPPEDDFDPDDYIRTAVTYGRLDVVKEWLPHHRDDPQRITQLVLFPAAMFGQFELLSFCLEYGEGIIQRNVFKCKLACSCLHKCPSTCRMTRIHSFLEVDRH